MAEYHRGKANNISGLEMPDGPNGKTLILHFKELKPAMMNSANGFFLGTCCSLPLFEKRSL